MSSNGHVRVTVDVSKARRVLKDAGKSFTKSNRRTVARGAAKILQDDMRQGAGGIIPKYAKSPYHIFSRGNYRLTIKSGNLRKSMKMFSFRRSGMMWVGPKYGKSSSGVTIGETYRTADGFYDKMYMAKTGNDFSGRSLARKAGEIRSRLMADADSWLKKIVAKAHATP